MQLPLPFSCSAILAAAYAMLPSPSRAADTVEVPYPPGEETIHWHHVYQEPDSDRAFRLAYTTPHQGDTRPGAKTYKMWYQVSADGGETYDELRPLVQEGEEFDRMHPIRPVHIPKNSYVASIPPPSRASNGEIMVPFWFWPLDEEGELAHEEDIYTFTSVGVLIGRWTGDGKDVTWDLGETVHLDFATESRRGANEPAIVELEEEGHFLMVIRGSNLGDPNMPSYKWMATSEDYCRTWSDAKPFTYADGEPLFSPSSCSVIRRNRVDGKIYWFGNISPENADGNHPRWPLVVGEVDEDSLGLIRETVRVLDTRDPERGDTEVVQFSNFKVKEDPETGDFIVTLTRLDAGRRKKGASGASRWSGVDWPKERYVVEITPSISPPGP